MKTALLYVLRTSFSFTPEALNNFELVIDKMNLPVDGYVFGDFPEETYLTVDLCFDLIKTDRRICKSKYSNHWINDERTFNLFLQMFIWANIDNLGDFYPWHFTDSQKIYVRRACDFLYELWNWIWTDTVWGRLTPSMRKRVGISDHFEVSSTPALSVFLFVQVCLVFLTCYYDQSIHGSEPNLSFKEYRRMMHQNMIHISRLLANAFRHPELCEDIPKLEPLRWGKFYAFEDHFKRSFSLSSDDLQNGFQDDEMKEISCMDID